MTIQENHIPFIASANLGLGGMSMLVSKIVPHLATIAVLLQIAVAAVSLWQMLKKKSINEKAPTNSVPSVEPDRVQQPNTQKSGTVSGQGPEVSDPVI